MIDELLKIGFKTKDKKVIKAIYNFLNSIEKNTIDEKIISTFRFNINQCNISIEYKRILREKTHIILYELISK